MCTYTGSMGSNGKFDGVKCVELLTKLAEPTNSLDENALRLLEYRGLKVCFAANFFGHDLPLLPLHYSNVLKGQERAHAPERKPQAG
jgi:hypothetical protein